MHNTPVISALAIKMKRDRDNLLAACKAVLKDEEESFGAYEYAISAKLRQQLVDAVAKAEGTK